MKSEAAEYRAENQELRKELESMRTNTNPAQNLTVENSSVAAQAPATNASTEQRVSVLEETNQVTQSELRTLYQTKVESASKYRVRLSGIVLLNLFHNRGEVDNLDVPTYASSFGPYGLSPSFGATVRQSELGLEVFGPELAGAPVAAASAARAAWFAPKPHPRFPNPEPAPALRAVPWRIR